MPSAELEAGALWVHMLQLGPGGQVWGLQFWFISIVATPLSWPVFCRIFTRCSVKRGMHYSTQSRQHSVSLGEAILCM